MVYIWFMHIPCPTGSPRPSKERRQDEGEKDEPYGTRKVRHALLKRAICTVALANVHVAYFISANYGFLHYPFRATMGVFQNSTCWNIAGTIGEGEVG